MTRLRHFQSTMVNRTFECWDMGHKNVLNQLCTGGGKTVIIGASIKRLDRPSCSMAHRNELVSQISRQLAKEEIAHDIIAPKAIIRQIINKHMECYGRSWYNPRSWHKVAGVDTLIRMDGGDKWFRETGIVVPDEAHHVLAENKWGRAVQMFPNALGLFPTATPDRADKKGLGRHASGLVDAMIQGPPMYWMIEQGYLTPYEVMTIPVDDLDLDGVNVTEGGDYNKTKLSAAIRKSQKLVGSVVDTYRAKCAAVGKWLLGVTFAADIESGERIVTGFKAAGIPSALVTGEDDTTYRDNMLRAFERREILQLVNVDLFGEGFDLPAIEYIAFARPTASFPVYAQQFGRVLRLLLEKHYQDNWDDYAPEQRRQIIAASEKPVGYIADHVGNVFAHNGTPDRRTEWTLDDTGRSRRATDGIPMRNCLNIECMLPYERIYDVCPYCGQAAPPPRERSGPEQVEGDLWLLTPEAQNALFGEIKRIDDSPYVPVAQRGQPAEHAIIRNHYERQAAQAHLRNAIAAWAGYYSHRPDRENYKRFYFTFGLDVASALALNEKDANSLRARIDVAISAMSG